MIRRTPYSQFWSEIEIKMTGIIVFQIEILYNDDENLRNNDGLSWTFQENYNIFFIFTP